MPHTSRNKKQQTRAQRIEVHDENGWTRVTKTSANSTRAHSQPLEQDDGSREALRTPRVKRPLRIEHHIPEDASVDKAVARFQFFEQRWLSSESWSVLKTALTATLLDSAQPVSSCVLFGSGSVTGCSRGWIERHHVALTQIAVFKSILDTITLVQRQPPVAYAQELEYNHLDSAFLQTLGINTVEDPKGFELLNKFSFAYAPGAEFGVAMRTIFAEPWLYLGHELDHYVRNGKGVAAAEDRYYGSREDGELRTLGDLEAEEDHAAKDSEEQQNDCRIAERFKSDHQSLKIPDFDGQDYPFHDQLIYYRATSSTSDEKASESRP